jgi:hypothetical protein
LTAFVLNGSVLHGRVQGPPKRPPRIA